jgi:hypothetical protein
MSACCELNLKMTDDETLLFNLEIVDAEGAPLTWSNFVFDYTIKSPAVTVNLAQGSGISVDTVSNALIITTPDPNYRLPVGIHPHGLRAKHIGTGVMVQLMDGDITVSEGNFA